MKKIAIVTTITFCVLCIAASPDVNNDGEVDLLDLVVIVNNFGTSNTQYDINSDGDIDLLDLVTVVKNFGTVAPLPPVCLTDVKTCSDGSTLTRDPNNNCQFPSCPSQPSSNIDCSNPKPEWVHCDNFEGNLAQGGYNQICGQCSIQADPAESDKALHIPYCVSPGSAGSAGVPCSGSRDANRFVSIDVLQHDLHHFFVGGRLYIPYSQNQADQKKLFFLFSKNWKGGSWQPGDPTSDWDMILAAWTIAGDNQNLRLQFGANSDPYNNLNVPTHCGTPLKYDQWQYLEMEVKLNTVGQSDGYVRVWVDGVQVCEKQGAVMRIDNVPIKFARWGAQINDNDGPYPSIEDRYWDDIVLSTSRI